MKKWPVAALLISWIPLSFGADALITGEGQVRSTPDFVELSIVIESKCYPTPGDARKFNDEAARKIVDFLNTKVKKKDIYNSVVSSGGYTLPYQTYYQDKVLCQNTFQKQNTIVFRTQDMKDFESLFNEIQNMVYDQFARSAPAVIEASLSFVTMSDPLPSISNELRSELEQKAIALAFIDAKSKLSALFGSKIQNVKMIHASELPPEPNPVYQREAAPMMMAGAHMAKKTENAPVQFEEQEIFKTIYFTFTFDDIAVPSSGQ